MICESSCCEYLILQCFKLTRNAVFHCCFWFFFHISFSFKSGDFKGVGNDDVGVPCVRVYLNRLHTSRDNKLKIGHQYKLMMENSKMATGTLCQMQKPSYVMINSQSDEMRKLIILITSHCLDKFEDYDQNSFKFQKYIYKTTCPQNLINISSNLQFW